MTLISIGDPESLDLKRWRPLSCSEAPVKVGFECVRRHVCKELAVPLLGPPSPELARQCYSRFCNTGVIAEAVVPGGGVQIPLLMVQAMVDGVDHARQESGGCTCAFLDITNGFGSIYHASMFASLEAVGLDKSSTCLLSYLYGHPEGLVGRKLLDLLVGIFQEAPPSQVT